MCWDLGSTWIPSSMRGLICGENGLEILESNIIVYSCFVYNTILSLNNLIDVEEFD